MMKKRAYLIIGTAGFLFSCSQTQQPAKWVSTTPDACFVEQPAVKLTEAAVPEDVAVLTNKPQQTIDGFGGCFNELGWVTLSALNETDREAVIRDLFGEEGMNFTFCRMPVGANDFARDWYSYNETDRDFEMTRFSIDNDQETLIPFIRAARKVNPNLRIWASPWSPPSWMKYNKHYACRPSEINGLPGDPNLSLEGSNQFIQEPAYFEAYALYFKKFIEAYRNEGIRIEMVAPQNEFNSCQIFPSCTWTAAGLATFIGDYLGPQMEALGVRLLFGTMERENHLLVDTVMQRKSGKFISEIGFQWAGKEAIGRIHQTYPGLKLMQSESECGNGQNTWEYCFYIWKLMKHYFNHGISSYMYWNLSLDAEPTNRWNWPQNSLVSVDRQNKTYSYNPEYYLMKHFSHFVKPGAVRLETAGAYENLLAFANPDRSIVIITANETTEARSLKIRIENRMIAVEINPQSVNSFVIEADK